LRGQTRDQAVGKILQEADGAAFWREIAHALQLQRRIDKKIGEGAGDGRMFDASCKLHTLRFVESEFVEQKSGDASRAIGIEEAALPARRRQNLT
jgi:hypothetical protein